MNVHFDPDEAVRIYTSEGWTEVKRRDLKQFTQTAETITEKTKRLGTFIWNLKVE
jgi:hypothetical protein